MRCTRRQPQLNCFTRLVLRAYIDVTLLSMTTLGTLAARPPNFPMPPMQPCLHNNASHRRSHTIASKSVKFDCNFVQLLINKCKLR